MQATARQNIGRHYQIQLSLLQGGLRVKCHARFKIHLYLRPVLMEIF